MGKGEIVSGGLDGLYQLKLIYAYRSRVENKIAKAQENITSIENRISAIEAEMAVETDPQKLSDLAIEKSVLTLQKTSLQKQIQYYQNNMPADPTQAAWCADLSEDLTGNVGTIEIPGEPSVVLVRPGYENRAEYVTARDGQLMPAIAGEPNQVLFNWMLLPGWQRHKPIYRAGTIVPDSLNFDANTCSVCLDAAYSSQQNLPAVDQAVISDCNMGDDDQSEYLTGSAKDFCSRNPLHPFCTQSEGSEIYLSDTLLAQLEEVNFYVNEAHSYAADKSGFAVGDSWDVMSPGESGDCEDFALTKMARLVSNYGWDPDNTKIVTAFTKDGRYHAMLGVRTTNRGLVILDNNYERVIESGRIPYRIDKIALTSNTWKNYTRKIENVTIEYMECDSTAFADNDRVVVEFDGQSWDNPKVIGFLENPKSCSLQLIYVLGFNGIPDSYSWSFLKYYIQADSWIGNELLPGDQRPGYPPGTPDEYIPTIRGDVFATQKNKDVYVFGGDRGTDVSTNYRRGDKRDGATATWSVLQDLPNERAKGQGFRLGNYHYIVSGAKAPYYNEIPELVCTMPYSTNYRYDDQADAFASKAAATPGYDNRSFVIDSIGFYMGGAGNFDFCTGRVPEFPHYLKGYNAESDTWVNYQDMNRGAHLHGSANIKGSGYIGNAWTDIARSGDRPFYYVVTSGLNPGDYGYFEPYFVLYAYYTQWIDKYIKNSDSWSAFFEMPELESWLRRGDGCFITGGEGGSPIGYGGFNYGWHDLDVFSETMTRLNQRVNFFYDNAYRRAVGI